MSVFIDSGLRHLLKFMAGEVDEDHLIAAVWNLMGAVTMEERVKKGVLPPELLDLPVGVDKL